MTTIQSITPQERDAAHQYLLSSYASVAETVSKFSPAQLSFKPTAECWSAAEITEHMALIANVVVQSVLVGVKQGPPPAPDVDNEKLAKRIRSVATRGTKIDAPPQFAPTGKWTVPESLDQLNAAHTALISALDTVQDLHAHTLAHPVIGPLDGYQWILLTAAHTERHLNQIREVTANPNFPAA
jgi:hypothetical protein